MFEGWFSAEAAAWAQAVLSFMAIWAGNRLYRKQRKDDQKIASGKRRFVLIRNGRAITRFIHYSIAAAEQLTADTVNNGGRASESSLRTLEPADVGELRAILGLLDDYAHPSDYILAMFLGDLEFYNAALDQLRTIAADPRCGDELVKKATDYALETAICASVRAQDVQRVIKALIRDNVEVMPWDDSMESIKSAKKKSA